MVELLVSFTSDHDPCPISFPNDAYIEHCALLGAPARPRMEVCHEVRDGGLFRRVQPKPSLPNTNRVSLAVETAVQLHAGSSQHRWRFRDVLGCNEI